MDRNFKTHKSFLTAKDAKDAKENQKVEIRFPARIDSASFALLCVLCVLCVLCG
jgi:hypothetical protein